MANPPAASEILRAGEADPQIALSMAPPKTKEPKKGEPLNEAKTARAPGKAINGKGLPHLPAAGWLRNLLAEQTGGEGTIYQKEHAIDILEEVLARCGRKNAELWEVIGSHCRGCLHGRRSGVHSASPPGRA